MKETLLGLIHKINKKVCLFITIPLISIILITIFRYKFFKTNEEIVDYIKNSSEYTSTVEYTVKNSKSTYSEKAIINYNRDYDTEIKFENGITFVYENTDTIEVEDNGYEYQTKSNNDLIYSLAIVSNLLECNDDKLKTNIENIKEEEDEWGDKEYIIIEMSVESNNKHINRVNMFIDKKEKVPFMTKIYDDNGDESARIVYKCFRYI